MYKHWNRKSLGYHLVSVSAFHRHLSAREEKNIPFFGSSRLCEGCWVLSASATCRAGGGKPLAWSQGHKGVNWPMVNGHHIAGGGFYPLELRVSAAVREWKLQTGFKTEVDGFLNSLLGPSNPTFLKNVPEKKKNYRGDKRNASRLWKATVKN